MKKFLCLLLILSMLLSSASALAAGSVVLKGGNSGNPVKLLQLELKELGYYKGKIDGNYGDTTKNAVSEFRQANGLGESSKLDEDTVLALHRAGGGKTLKKGSKSVAVYAVQRVLFFSGFLSDTPDGAFGAGTRAALIKFQKYSLDSMNAFLLEKDAKAKAEAAIISVPVLTDDEMPLVVDEPLPPTATANGKITSNWLEFILTGEIGYGPTLKKGDKSASVMRMQQRLKALKYMAAGIDGRFGTLSVMALKYFQYRNGLEQTGKLDKETQQKLYSEDAKKSDEYVSPYKAFVSRSKNRVWIYKWTGTGYDKLVKKFKCTTGKRSTPTITGTYQAVGQAGVRWWHMDGCWVQYCFIIDGGYFFHSLLYSKKGDSRPTSGSVYDLGRNASHGCVRLELKNAKWIYDHCMPGMTVVIK